MIIYCAGPIRGVKKYQKYYKKIIEHISSLNHSALSELNSEFSTSIPLTDKQIFVRDTKWIDRSNLMVAEVSGPSLGVGFEIAYCLYKKKIPVLALACKEVEKVSALIRGNMSQLFNFEVYNSEEDLRKYVEEFINKYQKD